MDEDCIAVAEEADVIITGGTSHFTVARLAGYTKFCRLLWSIQLLTPSVEPLAQLDGDLPSWHGNIHALWSLLLPDLPRFARPIAKPSTSSATV